MNQPAPTIETVANLYLAAKAQTTNRARAIEHVLASALRHGYSEAVVRRAARGIGKR